MPAIPTGGQTYESLPARSVPALVLGVDPERRAGPARLVVLVAVDERAQVVGRRAVSGGGRGVDALVVGHGRPDGGPALELALRAASLDEHLAVCFDRGRRAGEVDLAALQCGHVLGDPPRVEPRLHG